MPAITALLLLYFIVGLLACEIIFHKCVDEKILDI